MYTLSFTDQTVDPISKAPIEVPAGSVVSTAADLSLTGKGAANYGQLQQENLLHILENYASATAPSNPTIGQNWFDTESLTLKVLVDKSPITWKSLGGIQITEIGEAPPVPPALGDLWFERTGSASGFLYTYTGLGRYPTTATTIGGWAQIYPPVDVAAGRDEYDAFRQQLDNMMGPGVEAYGSGALGRSITNLTNFAALDLDLRQKYDAIALANGIDATVLTSTTGDIAITSQAPSTTLFLYTDTSTPNDGWIGLESTSTPGTIDNGTIIFNGSQLTAIGGVLNTDFLLEDTYIMYDIDAALNAGRYYYAIRYTNSVWQYDAGGGTLTWTTFTPTARMAIIGSLSTNQTDGGGVPYPGTKAAAIWATAVPIVGVKTTHLKVEPNSQDWDTLLAALRYGLNRLEIPRGLIDSVSQMPFVNDGRQAHSTLLALDPTNYRYPSAARRSGRRLGTITHVQNFTETLNALNVGLANRFSLMGINGATGTNTTLANTTQITAHTTQSAVVASGTGNLRFKVKFANFTERQRFLGAGLGFQIAVTHTGGALAGDTNFRALLNVNNTFRLTADKTRIFGPSLPLTIVKPTSNVGIYNATSTGVVLTSQTLGASSISLIAYRVTDLEPSIELEVQFAAGSALAGTTAIQISNITSTEVYGAPSAPVYPIPQAFASGDIVDPL